MNKAELIERIIDTFTDMGSEDSVDIAYGNPLTIEEAKTYLDELRANERIDLEPDEWLPEEITPQIYMEAYNCYLRKCKHDVTARRIAEFIANDEQVETYHEFDGKYISYKDKIVYPISWLMENMEFPFTSEDLTMLDLITLGQNSPDFNPQQKFCWFDIVNNKLYSTNTPFADGLIDATAFAEWILEDNERIQYLKEWCMVDSEIDYVFEVYM